jgi:DNA-directed RNA polymerase subunit RPC12/RpoP
MGKVVPEIDWKKEHISHDGKMFVCKECRKKYLTVETFLNHLTRIGHNNDTILCPECSSKSVPGIVYLASHMVISHVLFQ